ncbi:butyrophilin-like protein 2 isoform X5 [Thunnus albacares]|uniref:butyrophilin-like protein 2 isoform X5 n=1 Tax=Thunnus albacares TaxID=8236 RepID=UPI001CF6F371|nr:butyrophilin-like protein 2 isoform X5 [Thunnus albacares]
MQTSYFDLIVKMLLMAFLGVLHFTVIVSGASRLSCPTPSIEVAEGDNVTLHCHLDPLNNVSAYTADWKRIDLKEVVYSYRHGRHNHDAQTERYRDRTTFNLDGPSRGDLTLQISSAHLDDSGPYRCFVPKLGISCVVNVSVEPKDQQNRTKRDGDITTSGPPVEDVTKSDHHDAAKTRTYYPTAATVVGFVIVIGLLVKRGTIKDC